MLLCSHAYEFHKIWYIIKKSRAEPSRLTLRENGGILSKPLRIGLTSIFGCRSGRSPFLIATDVCPIRGAFPSLRVLAVSSAMNLGETGFIVISISLAYRRIRRTIPCPHTGCRGRCFVPSRPRRTGHTNAAPRRSPCPGRDRRMRHKTRSTLP